MTLQELEIQLLNLSPTDRLRIIQFVAESLIPSIGEPIHESASLELVSDRLWKLLQ